MINKSGIFKQASRWIILLIVLGLISWNIYWILNNEPEHDEVEHWHAAWLMYKGQTPFYDFFEHHSPALWMILRNYYDAFGENYGIILVSRLMMIGFLFITVYLTYRTALYWVSPPAAWIAAVGYLLMNVGYFLAHVYVRGDPLILMLLMAALYFAVPLSEKLTWDRIDLEKLFLVFALLGIALAISPRAGIPVATLFLTLGLLSLGVRPFRQLFGLFFVGGMVILTPTVVLALPYGIEPYAFWVYKFSALIIPVSSPIYGILNITKAAFPVAILTLLGIYRACRKPDLRQRRSIWLLGALSVTGFAGLWACRHPFMQHFLMTYPFLGLFAALGYEEVIGSLQARRWLPLWNFGKIFAFLALLLLSYKFYVLWQHRDDATLSNWLERSKWMIKYSGKDRYFAAGTAFYGPIFMPDAFYYWFGARYTNPTLQAIRTDFKPYTFESLKKRRPALLHASFPENWNLTVTPEYQSWLEANYDPAPYKDYWIRKDVEAGPVETIPPTPLDKGGKKDTK